MKSWNMIGRYAFLWSVCFTHLFVCLVGYAKRQLGRKRAFAYAPLARQHQNDVSDRLQTLTNTLYCYTKHTEIIFSL